MTREEMWKEFEKQLIRETRTPITVSYDVSEKMTKSAIERTVAKWKDRLEQEPTTKNDLVVEKTDMIDKSNFSQKQYKADLQSAYDSGYEQAKNDLGVDAVSRADAIKAMQEKAKKLTNEDTINGLCGAVAILYDFPPATPIRPKGHWIVQPSNKEQGERDFIWWKCSECGQVIFSETEHDRVEFHAFCGRCGADMSEVEE